jgi:hypothetical protein
MESSGHVQQRVMHPGEQPGVPGFEDESSKIKTSIPLYHENHT